MSSRKPPSRYIPPAPVSLPRSPADEADERRMFEREFADVRPLRRGPSRIVPDHTATDSKPSAGSSRKAPSPDQRMLVDQRGEVVTGASYGVSHLTVAALGKGEMAPEATCNLHGLHVEVARHRLVRFVEDAVAAGRRVVLIVCGQGHHSGPQGPVLPELTLRALCTPPLLARVLAFSSAPREMGGAGAFVVMLRRSSDKL